jgi:mevalonate kinase
LVLPVAGSILSPSQKQSNAIIKKLAIEISHQESLVSNENTYNLLEDELIGLYFDSSIPTSYGVGSSGALVAAIYDRYFNPAPTVQITDNQNLTQIKNELAQLESFFHGKSSGTDPLVSYLNAPVLLNAPENHVEFKIPSTLKVFLIDTRRKSSTKDFIHLFDTKINSKPQLLKKFIQKNNESINAFLDNRPNCFDVLKDFSEFEHEFLPEMFYYTDSISLLLEKHKLNLAIKLCGSGGGGFLLGFAKIEVFKDIESDFSKNNIPIDLLTVESQKLTVLANK